MLFKDLPIWAHFFLPHDDDVCCKTAPTTAVDCSCAPGFCFTVRPDQNCDLAVRKAEPVAQTVPTNCAGS